MNRHEQMRQLEQQEAALIAAFNATECPAEAENLLDRIAEVQFALMCLSVEH